MITARSINMTTAAGMTTPMNMYRLMLLASDDELERGVSAVTRIISDIMTPSLEEK